MTIVVTGSSGLLGRHVTQAIRSAGHDVVGIDTAPPQDERALDHITADLKDLGAAMALVRDAKAVVHAAAIPRPLGRVAHDVFTTNVTATFNVVEAAALNGVPRIVYASSYSITGFPFNEAPVTPSYFPFDRDYPAAPQDAYALSKWLGEEIVAAAIRKSDMSAVSLRMPWIQTAESFANDIAPHRDDPDFAAQNLWSYLDARDAGAAFLAAVEAELDGHRRLFVSAADTFADVPTAELLRDTYPTVPLKRPIAATDTIFAIEEPRDVLGFQPQYSWRSY